MYLRITIEIVNSSLTYNQRIQRRGKITSRFKLVVVAVDSKGMKKEIPEHVRRLLEGFLNLLRSSIAIEVIKNHIFFIYH